ncbi:sialate O-acetylesterase [Terrimonas sp. NA20]|uniref:Sialate O-acetylesterase n=1 Tax=Terrimonas ginsenosidimutans TaxID=2908004 RepID=A0ABS9KSL6_9BACT|nr:sialate O-acetylesterase [Terrimonas ginsenosidimutans]MCG2615309.1 sialate O-acetylesterase [Terrimonas ginsenosidimutans]
MNRSLSYFLQTMLVGLLLQKTSFAQLKLPNLISDNMVLQRDLPLTLWGWATPGATVHFLFQGKSAETIAAADGKWKFRLSALKPGVPVEMSFTSEGRTTTVRNILVGDVWLCSGQSNMDYQLYKAKQSYPKEIADAGNYQIREFAVKNPYGFQKSENATGSWKPATPDNVLMYSAVGYFFARSLYEKYTIPIGIIHASYPGTAAEGWMSEEGLAQFPHYLEKAKPFRNERYSDSVKARDKRVNDEWMNEQRRGDTGLAKQWGSNNTDLSGWGKYSVPGYWEDQGMQQDGVIWIKKEIEVDASFLPGEKYLELGMIDDVDSTYFNGYWVGSKDNRYLERRYRIPDSIIRAGRNMITIRIVDKEGRGGVIAGRRYRLTNGTTSIDLSGEWNLKTGVVMRPMPVGSFTRIEYLPEIMYHSRIEPLIGYGIKGVLWYQGEANTGKAIEYRTLLPAMINDWRTRWGQGNFPFLIVQLANYMKPPVEPVKSNWAMLRESQAKVADSIPNAGLAVAIDLGEEFDIHPANKKDVGERLALTARHLVYGDKKTVYSGPVYKSMTVENGKVVLEFDHKGKGLTGKNGELMYFATAGADRVFHWARAGIRNGKVIVWSEKVKVPVAVRYAWADNPQGANFYNVEGLPAVPFRTDNWDN